MLEKRIFIVVIGSEKQNSYSMTKSLWDIFSNQLHITQDSQIKDETKA